MHAEIRTVKNPDLRVRIVEERTAFDQEPQIWVDKYQEEQNALRTQLVSAQDL